MTDKELATVETMMDALEKSYQVLRGIMACLNELKRGSCWCDMALGNPVVNTHTPGCLMAQKLMK